MSKVIDEKVVSLQFDNAEFEKNVRTSMKTLGDFEKATKLDGATTGLQDMEKAANKFSLANLVNQSELAQKSFTTLEKISIGVFAEIGRQATQAGERILYSLTGIEQFNAGYGKYEEKVQSVQTLVNATGKSVDEINGYLDQLMRFSDETSYGFTQMASSLSQLATSGGDLDKLLPMIMGIANATAFAGKSQNEFARAIYNLNQSYGAGYLKYMDWKSLELAGIASKQLKQAFIDTAIAMGKLDSKGKTAKGTLVDIGNFGQTLQEQWADTGVMEKTFGLFYKYTAQADEMVRSGAVDTYTEAYREMLNANADLAKDTYFLAAKAAQEAATFNQAILATKDAVSSKWMASFEIVFGNYEEAKKLWSALAEDLYTIFAEPGDKRNDFLKRIFDDTYSQLTTYLGEAGVEVETFESQFSEYLKKTGYNVDYAIEKYGSLKNALNSDSMVGNVLRANLKKFFTSIEEGSLAVEKTTNSLENLQQVFNDIWSGKYGNGQERIEKLTEAGYDYTQMQELINKLAKEGHREGYQLTLADIEGLTDAELKNIGVSKEEAEALRKLAKEAEDANTPLSQLINNMGRKSGRELLSGIILNLTGSIIALKKTVGEAWSQVFNVNLAEVVYQIVQRIYDFTGAIKDTIENSNILKTAFRGLFTVFNIIGKAIELAYTAISQTFKAVGIAISKYFDFKVIEKDVGEFGDTISEALDNAIKWLNENQTIFTLVEGAANAVIGAIGYVKQEIDKILETDAVKSALDTIKKNFENFSLKNLSFDSIASFFTNFNVNDLKTTFENIINKFDFKSIGDLISEKFNNIEWFSIDDLLSGETKVGEVLETATLEVADIAGRSGGTLVKAGVELNKGFEEVVAPLKLTPEEWAELGKKLRKGLDTALGWLMTGSVIYGFKGLSDALQNVMGALVTPLATINTVLKAWGTVAASINNTLGNISLYFTNLTGQIKVNNILKLSIAIGILTGVFYLMAKIDRFTMYEALAVTVTMMVVLKSMAEAMTMSRSDIKAISDAKFTDIAIMLLGLAGSFMIISIALKRLADLQNPIQAGVFGLAIMTGLLVGVFLLLKGLSKNVLSIQNVGGGIGAITGLMLGIAVSFSLIASAMKKFTKIRIDDYASFFVSIITSIVTIVTLAYALRGIKAGSALPIIAIAISLYAFVKVLENLTTLDYRAIYVALVRLLPIITIFGILLKAANGGGIAKSGLASLGAFFLAMAASAVLVIKAMKSFATLNVEELLKGGIGVVALITVLSGVSVVISKSILGRATLPPRAAGVILSMCLLMVSICASVYLLVGAVMIFKGMDWAELGKGIGSVVAILLSLGFMLGKIGRGFAGLTPQSASAMTTMLIIIGLIIAAIVGFTFLPIDKVMYAAGSLALVFAALTAMIFALTVFTKSNSVDAGEIVTFVGIIAAVSAVIWALTNFTKNPKDALTMARALSETMLALSLSMLVLTGALLINSAIPWSTVGKVAAEMAGFLLIAGATLTLMTNLIKNPEAAIPVAEGLSKLMLALSAAMVGMSVAGLVASAATPNAIWNLVGVIGAISAVLVAVSGLATWLISEGYLSEETLDQMIVVSEKIGAFLGGFVGNLAGSFIAGFNDTVMQSVARIGLYLSNFATNVQGFLNLEIPDTFTDTLKAFGDILLVLGSNLNTINTIGNSNTKWKDFNVFMYGYADAIKNFSKALGGSIDADAVNAAANAGLMFAELANSLGANKSGGLFNNVVEFFTGKPQTFKDFAENMKDFGLGLVAMSMALTSNGGIKPETVENAITVGKMLKEFEGTLGRNGGLLQVLIGSQDIGKFGDRAALFGNGLVALSQSVSKVDVTGIEKLKGVGEKLRDLENTLAESKSLMGLLTGGDQNLGDFGSRIKLFAEGLVNAFDAINGVFTKRTYVVPNGQGFIAEIIRGMNTGSEDETEEDRIYSKVDRLITFATTIGTKFSELETGLAANGGLFGESSNLGTFSSGIGSFATNMKTFGSSLSEVTVPDATKQENFLKLCETIGDISKITVDDAGKSNITNIGEAGKTLWNNISGLVTGVTSMGDNAATSLSSALQSLVGNIDGSGVDLMGAEQTVENVKATLADVSSEVTKSAGSGALASIKSTISGFMEDVVELLNKRTTVVEYAKNILQGFLEGITDADLLASVWNAVDSFASGVISKLQFTWEINSPSKVTAEMGKYLVAGLVVGIDDEMDSAANSAYEAGLTVTRSIAEALNAADSILEDQMNPVITPVLDLTDITNGVNTIGSMLDTSQSYNAALAVKGSRLAYAGAGNQNGGVNGHVNVTINPTFNVNTNGQITRETVRSWASWLADDLNEELGKRF